MKGLTGWIILLIFLGILLGILAVSFFISFTPEGITINIGINLTNLTLPNIMGIL
jgi:hypothetical protein